MKNFLILILVAYFLIIFQTSFLAHFGVWRYLPNLAILFVVFFNLFENQQEKNGLAIAGISGFLLDVFSASPFGLYTAILIMAALIIKIIVKRYFYLKFSK